MCIIRDLKFQFKLIHEKIRRDLQKKYPGADIGVYWHEHELYENWVNLHKKLVQLDQEWVFQFLDL